VTCFPSQIEIESAPGTRTALITICRAGKCTRRTQHDNW